LPTSSRSLTGLTSAKSSAACRRYSAQTGCAQPEIQTRPRYAAAGAHAHSVTAPYLSVSLSELKATLLRRPERTEVPVLCDEQLVVEFYSR
jgi:small subunit ribosomal protein S4